MRIAQFSDIHYSGANLAEADRCFSFAVDEAVRQGVQAAVISGDATDRALDVHHPAVERLARHVRRLADHCPVLMLQGTYTHEPPGTLSIFRLLGGRYRVHVSDRIEQVALRADGSWQPSPAWRFDALPVDAQALFSCLPTLNKATLAASVGAAAAAQAVGEHVAHVLAGFAPINQVARRAGVATVGDSHGTVNGCLTEHGVPMAGLDHEFTVGALWTAGAQAFMLGHIHRHQAWWDERNERCVAYAGSLGRYHHGELGEKGFLLWEVEPTTTQMSLVPTPARRTVDLRFDGRPDLERIRAAVREQQLEGAHVRISWVVAEEDRQGVDRAAIAKLLEGAAGVQLEGRVVPVLRGRAEGISVAPSLADKIGTWARLAQCPLEPLLACLEQLQTASPAEIAAQVLTEPDAPAMLAAPSTADMRIGSGADDERDARGSQRNEREAGRAVPRVQRLVHPGL